METKENYYLPFKNNQNFVITDTSNNLNLNQNQNHQASNAFLSCSKNDKNDKKKFLGYDFGDNIDFQTTPKDPWKKSNKTLSPIFLPSNGCHRQNSVEKELINTEKVKKNSSKNSTLSLHIAAYENCSNEIIISTDNDKSNNDKLKMNDENSIKMRIKQFSPCSTFSIPPNSQKSSEFPRQQQQQHRQQQNDDQREKIEAEVIQFKATQKLLKPNESPIGKALQQQPRQRNFITSTSSLTPSKSSHQNISNSSRLPRLSSSSNHGVFSDTFIMRNGQNNLEGSWTEGKEIAEREHNGRGLTFPLSMSCDVCKKRFGFTRKAYECRDCNLRFHRHCKNLAPMPCIPKSLLPSSPTRQNCILIDFCSSSHPYIPSVIIHCTIALEREHLDREGIYRISGTVSAVTKLLNDFLFSRVIPDLTNVPTENITGCIKKFLKELNDSIVPSSSFNHFMQAIEANDEQQVITGVFELPAPNRDTLAYLILHLQKVAKFSSSNKMPIENLARVLAPTIIGYSKRFTVKMSEEFTISCHQTMILHRLLNLPSQFWSQFIENNISHFAMATSTEEEEEDEIVPTRKSTTRSKSDADILAAAARPTTPIMMIPRSFSSRQPLRIITNNNSKTGLRDTHSEEKPRPKRPSPIMRSFSYASSFVRSFRSAF